jgi:hypothetical protein
MLRSSDDGAAQDFWNRFGGGRIVGDVLGRYRMGDARITPAWYDTLVSPADMVGYYNQLLGGQGGLPPAARDFLVSQLRASTPVGTDGYDQRFGLPGGLNDAVQAVKQGWMIAEDGNWVHNSTDVVGPDSRYIIVVFSQEPARFGDGSARQTIDRVANIMFPARTAQEGPSIITPYVTESLPGPVQLLIGSVHQILGSAIHAFNRTG